MSPLPGDLIWYVSFRSGVATLRTAIHFLLAYLFLCSGWTAMTTDVFLANERQNN